LLIEIAHADLSGRHLTVCGAFSPERQGLRSRQDDEAVPAPDERKQARADWFGDRRCPGSFAGRAEQRYADDPLRRIVAHPVANPIKTGSMKCFRPPACRATIDFLDGADTGGDAERPAAGVSNIGQMQGMWSVQR